VNAAEFLLGATALERHGERIALVSGARSLTYQELAAEMARAANALRARGVMPGERVLLLMRDTPQLAAAWLGAVHAGAVAVLVNPRLADEDLRHVFADCRPRLTLLDDDHAWQAEVRSAAPHAEPFAADAADPAFWLYSSGTTGRPKGVVHAHRSVLSAGQALREVFGIQPGERVLATSKLFFAYGLENGLLGPLASGATALLHAHWPDAEAIVDLVARERPAAFFSVPTFYRRLLELAPERLAPFAGVRRCISAGERLPAPIFDRWREATGGTILSLYGTSETFCVCIATAPGSASAEHTGQPLRGVATRLDNGVLWVRHTACALGYANLPQDTAARFKDGWFCSNDVFSVDARGFFSHQGRADEMLKVAGQWVRPTELEQALAGEPAIAEAACVRVADPQGFDRLALFVTSARPADEARRVAVLACEQALPGFKRPHWVRVVDALPRTATGKVQHFRLRELIERELGENSATQ
jgi:3-hydroxybenzoate/4-hydroxybenzoate---CoA ligase